MGIAQSRLVAVVTGASSGLGYATAEALAARGYDLVLSSRNPVRAAERIAEASGVTVRAVAGSIADPATATAIAAAAEAMGGASALLLNHGGPKVSAVMELTDDDWRSAFAMMVTGPLGVLRAVVPQMRAKGQGRVLAVSSFTVKSPWGGIALSNSLRAALVNALKTAALELGPEGILVNALAPGYIETDRIRDWNIQFAASEGVTPKEIAARSLDRIPLGRYGTAEGYGRMAAFLLSQDNDYISGQQILYDGALVVAT